MDSPFPESLSPTVFMGGPDESSFLELCHQNDVLKKGTIVANRYCVIDLIGKGGMGAVYTVKHLTLNKILAMKVMWSDYATHPIHSLRFTVEAKAASDLEHPNLVSVRDFGIGESIPPYLVMDYIEGRSLAEVFLQSRTLDWKEVVNIGTQIADGLNYSHDLGIVHRDLKPTNILVSGTAGGSTQVKVVDFGIAKVSYLSSELQSVTRTGEIFGSPLYMSPEQCSGQTADRRSDIYSLGCVLYEALAGKPPFESDNSVSTMFKHMTEIPRRLSDVSRNFVPVQLQRIILKCLEKNPDNRFQTMEALRLALVNVRDLPKPRISLTLPAVSLPVKPCAPELKTPVCLKTIDLEIPSYRRMLVYFCAFFLSVGLGFWLAVTTGSAARSAVVQPRCHVKNAICAPAHQKMGTSHKVV